MATYAITGKITDAAGNGVPGVQVLVTPAPADVGAAAAIAGVGIISTPVAGSTDGSGDFSLAIEEGFRYRLDISAIGFSRSFVMPGAAVRFDLLGLIPAIESITDWVDVDGVDQIQVTVKADPIATVRERYTEIVIEKAPSQTGTYAEVATIELAADVIFYEYAAAGPNTEWYRAKYRKSADNSQYSEPIEANSAREELVISVDELKELYLFGVDLTDSDGNPFPDRLIAHYIEAAVAWLEKELDIRITPIEVVDELHDHYAMDYGRWGYFQLREYPLIVPPGTPPSGEGQDTVSVAFQYPSQTSKVDIQNEWIVVTEGGQTGVIQIVPGQGNIADVLLIPGHLMPMWSGAFGRVPGVWRFSYRAGFEVGDAPRDIVHAIGMAASIGVFNIAGDLIAGAGIATISTSVPGLSQNIGTTSSATNSGYGARIGEYTKELKEMLPNLRRYYGKGSRMYVV